MNNSNKDRPPFNIGSLLLGGLLVLLGVLFLLGQFIDLIFGINLGGFTWPLFIILPGIILLVIAFTVREGRGLPLAILGSMVTTTGLLLAYQNFTNHWTSWAYAWALIAPTSTGLGMALFGAVKGRNLDLRNGLRMAGIGLVIFLAGAVFFELALGISGFGIRLNSLCWPVMLIGLGVLLLLLNLLPRRRNPSSGPQE
jgi:hypothetical protein